MNIKSFLGSVQTLAVAAAAALTMGATPAQAEFMGGGYINAVTGCRAAGFPVGSQMVRARYAAVETDRVNSIVLFFAVGGANSYSIPGGPMTPSTSFRSGTGSATWGAQYVMDPRPAIRVLERETIVPMARVSTSRVDENTRMVRLRLHIRNFNGVQGCTANAVLTMARWD